MTVESPIHYSNVNLVDPVTGSPVRVSVRYLEDGTKVRVTRGRLASQSIIPRPDILTTRRKPRSSAVGSKDTPRDVVNKNTYVPSPEFDGF